VDGRLLERKVRSKRRGPIIHDIYPMIKLWESSRHQSYSRFRE